MIEEDDDGFVPPEAVRFEHEAMSTCPSCGKALKRHSSLELLRCAESVPDEPEAHGNALGGASSVETCPICRGQGRHVEGCEAAAAADGYEEAKEKEGAYQEWRRKRAAQGLRVPRRAPSPSPSDVIVPDDVVHAITPDDIRQGVAGLPNILPLPDGGIDYEALAAALRTVIERERDEIVRRGGPLEKQNQELKERLASALDEAALWRRRCQGNAEARNSLDEQLREAQKTIRRLKADGRRERSGDRPKATSVPDIIRAVEATKDFTVKKLGNGHFGIYKSGVFVTDMASSPGQERANMATRVKLRKAGVDV